MASADLEDIRKVLQNLEAEKNHALCENQELKCNLIQLKDEICEMQTANDKLIEELEYADRAAKKLKSENCKLEQCIQEKEEELCCFAKLCDEIENLKNVISQLERDLSCIDKENCNLEEQIAELTRCIQDKDGCIRRLENKLCELEREVCEMENTIKYYSDENECLKQELEECQSNLQKMNEEYACLCSNLKSCECAKRKLQEQIQNLQTALDHAHDALQREQTCGCKLKQQIKAAKEENHKLKMENSCLHEENCELNIKIDAYTKKLKQCQCEYQRVQCECEEFKRSIERFKKQIFNGIKCNTQPECCATAIIGSRYSKSLARARSATFSSRVTIGSKRSSCLRNVGCEPDCT